ncbi:MAG: DUF2750 domain-containing protein, partial [Opitutaceae bacterium]|nr:DUF2750 domain-containing protein [Opitutaceae bacterium]
LIFDVGQNKMLQNRATSQESYDRFVDRVRHSGQAYGLRSPDGGWAVCPSHENEGVSVLVFWSDRAYAARHQKEDWSEYVPTAIALDEFIGAWLKGMHADGSMVGPNWDVNLCGLEVRAIDLAKRLTEE